MVIQNHDYLISAFIVFCVNQQAYSFEYELY